MFRHPGELAFYVVVLAVKIVGFLFVSLRLQVKYGRARDVLHAVGLTLVATFLDQAVLLSLIASWRFLAGVSPDGSSNPDRGLVLLVLLLVCFRYFCWVAVLWTFFRGEFRDRASWRYAVVLTLVGIGLDLAGAVVGMATPAGRQVFFF